MRYRPCGEKTGRRYRKKLWKNGKEKMEIGRMLEIAGTIISHERILA
jgi:hypothetical protein